MGMKVILRVSSTDCGNTWSGEVLQSPFTPIPVWESEVC
jgi:hypothetical protein